MVARGDARDAITNWCHSVTSLLGFNLQILPYRAGHEAFPVSP